MCIRDRDRTQKVTANSLSTLTPFPLSHINQILHVGSYPGCLSWFQVSLRSVEKCGSSEGQNFGLPIDLARRLYNCLWLPHKPWFSTPLTKTSLLFFTFCSYFSISPNKSSFSLIFNFPLFFNLHLYQNFPLVSTFSLFFTLSVFFKFPPTKLSFLLFLLFFIFSI